MVDEVDQMLGRKEKIEGQGDPVEQLEESLEHNPDRYDGTATTEGLKGLVEEPGLDSQSSAVDLDGSRDPYDDSSGDRYLSDRVI